MTTPAESAKAAIATAPTESAKAALAIEAITRFLAIAEAAEAHRLTFPSTRQWTPTERALSDALDALKAL